MGARPAEQPFDKRTAALIRLKVRKLVGRYGFKRDDEPDLRQELAMHVVKGLKGHDPTRSSERTFAARIIESKVASIVRRASAAKRDRRRLGAGVELEELQARDGAAIENRELQDAVQAALSGLPPQTRSVANLLMESGQLEVARRLGITRQQVRTECKRIEGCLGAQGFGTTKKYRRQPTDGPTA